MVPAPASTAPLSKKLPISGQALEALNKARSTKNASELNTLTSSIVSAALGDSNDIHAKAFKYVLNRLLSGVSVSLGETRINFSTILLVLVRAVIDSGVSEPVSEIILAVKEIYGMNGSFETGYSGAERERALGTLAACAAVVNAASTKISPSVGKEIIGLLRLTVNGAASKWKLGGPAVEVICKLLDGASNTNRKALTKQLWSWCEERRKMEDGLLLSIIMLRKYKLVQGKAFNSLYSQLGGDFTKALSDSLESGFSLLDTYETRQFTGKEANFQSIVPITWIETVKYLTIEECEIHGGFGSFWKQIVTPKLIEGNRSPEKGLFALDLMLLALENIKDVASFRLIFNTSSASLFSSLEAIGNARRKRNRIREGRVTEPLRAQIKSRIFEFGEKVIAELSRSTRSTDECMGLLNEFLLWGVRQGILHQILHKDGLFKALNLYNKNDVIALFKEVVKEFIHPCSDAKKDNSTNITSSIRSAIIRFMLAVATHHPFLGKDAIRFILIFSVFEVDDSFPIESCHFEFVNFVQKSKKEKNDSIPISPKPPLSLAMCGVTFRRLIDFLSVNRAEDETGTFPAFCIDFISELIATDNVSFRCIATENNENGMSSSMLESFKNDILPICKHENNGKLPKKAQPLVLSLQMAASYIGLLLFEPVIPESSTIDEEQSPAETLGMLCKMMTTCFSSLKSSGKKRKKVSASDGEGPETNPPDSLEQITHIVTVLCGMDSSCYRQIAIRIIGCLGNNIDDRVVAVLFDAMESYLVVPENESDVEEIFDAEDAEDKGTNIIRVSDIIGDNHASDSDDDLPEQGGPKKKPRKGKLKGKKQPNEEEPSDSDSEVEDMDMDIEDVDPEALEEFDKRVGSHLKLIKIQKKVATHRRLKIEFKYTKVSRILTIIEAIARMLRMRLEKDEEDRRLPIVFVDLHVRLFEFALSPTADNLRYLSQVSGIVSKHMQISTSHLSKKIADFQTVKDLVDRFFKVLIDCKAEKKPSENDIRTLSKSAGCLLSLAVGDGKEDEDFFASYYTQLLEKMLRPTRHFAAPGLFNSFIQKYPKMCVFLLTEVGERISKDVSKSIRHTASELLLLLASCARQNNAENATEVNPFWGKFVTFLQDNCTPKTLKTNWNRGAILNLAQACSLGMKSGILAEKEVSKVFDDMISSVTRTKRERQKLLKSLKPGKVATSEDTTPKMGK